MTGHGIQCHDLGDVVVFGHRLFSMISEACSSLVDSAILGLVLPVLKIM